MDFNFTAKGAISGCLTLGNPVVPIPLFLGLSLEVGAEIKIGAECSISISANRTYYFNTHSADYADKPDREILYSDSDFAEHKNSEQKSEAKVSGNFYLTFTPSLKVSFLGVVKVGIETPIKYQVKATFFSASNEDPDLDDLNVKVGTVAMVAPSGSSKSEPIHACKACFRIEPSLTIKISVTLKFIKNYNLDLLERTWNFTPLHWSLSYGEFKSGECQHYLYPTDISITGKEDEKLSDLVLEVDNEKVNTGIGGGVSLFLSPNQSHSYKVYSDEKVIKSGSFSVGSEYSSIKVDLDSGVKKEGSSPVVTTTAAPPQNPEIHTVESVISKIKEENPDHLMLEYGQLGDNVFYSLYPDGLLYISGYGPMNITSDPIKNRKLVKNVIFEDYSHCLMSELAVDTDNEILLDEYIEKYHEDMSKLYLEKHRDKIVDILNKDYEVEKDDPYLDEMVNDYIYANSKDIAREYYEENKTEYAGKLIEFKKELLAGLGDKVITTIGDNLFRNCTNLESITYEGSPNEGKVAVELPPSITKIGNNAFEDCRSLPFGDFKLHDGVTSIGGNAFQECHGMISCTIPNSVESMGGSLFRWCLNLEKVSLPFAGATKDSKIGTIINLLFGIAPRGEVIIKPAEYYEYQDKFISHQYIPYGPDYDPPSLTAPVWRDCNLPKNFKEIAITGGYQIPENAFAFCTFLEKLTLPDTIESIGVYAFYDCNKVKELNLTDNLKNIGNNAFMQCSSLEKIILSENITTIGNSAFVQTGEAKVYIPEKIDNIPDDAFNTSAPNTIYGYKGSFAEKYANNKKIKFVAYGSDDFSIERTTTTTTTTTVTTTTTTTVPTPAKTTTTSSGTPAEGVRGDANGDGELDMSDAVLIMQALANPNKYGTSGTSPTHITAEGFKYADTDGNGLTVNDALRIQKFLLGLIKSFDE